MRRCFAIFLLAFLPLQFSWAAVASYCGHESGAQAQHLGHHDHQHADQTGHADSSTVNDLANGAAPAASDLDCGHCHTSCCAVPAFAASQHAQTIASQPVTPVEGSARTLAQTPPERPQWVRFA